MPAALIDTVTLTSFAEIDRLDLIGLTIDLNQPVVCEAVHDEIVHRANRLESREVAQRILDWPGLGEPARPTVGQLSEVANMRIALAAPGDGPSKHLGEAESLVLAGSLSCLFVTDDNSAYDFAERKLGIGRVWDTVKVLSMLIANGEIGTTEAAQITENMRDADRSLRRCHPDPITETDLA